MRTMFFPRVKIWALVASLGLVVTAHVAATSASAQEMESLCADDVMRLCSEFVPDRGQITRCMMKRRASVSLACRAAYFKSKPSLRKRHG